MKKSPLHLLLLSLIFIAAYSSSWAEETPASKNNNANETSNEISSNPAPHDSKLIPVEIHWEKVEGAAIYQIDILDLKGKVLRSVESPTAGFRFKMKLGDYLVRSRVADKKRIWSDWSDSSPFKVTPPIPEIKEAPKVSAEKIKNKIHGKAHVEWTPVPIADSYQFTLKDKAGKIVKQFSTEQTAVDLEIPPGTYSYEIATETKDGWKSEPMVSSEPIFITHQAAPEPTVKANPQNPREMNLNFGDKMEVHLEIEYCPHLSDQWKKITEGYSVENKLLKFAPDIRPGKYRYTIWATQPGWVDSEKIRKEFVIKPIEQDLQKL